MLHATSGTSSSSSESDGYNSVTAWQIAKAVVASSQTFLDSGQGALKEVSPLALHSSYKAATVFIQLNRENPSEDTLHALETLKSALQMKNRKWRVAGKISSTLLFLLLETENFLQVHICKFWKLGKS
jgi:hydrogenase maturation factor